MWTKTVDWSLLSVDLKKEILCFQKKFSRAVAPLY